MFKCQIHLESEDILLGTHNSEGVFFKLGEALKWEGLG